MSASDITLSKLRDRVEESLGDSGNDHYSTALLDEAIKKALSEYSAAKPRLAQTVLSLTGNLSSNGREVDISSISGLVQVTEIWANYTASDDKATVRNFEAWPDLDLAVVPDGAVLEATESARIFYHAEHTLNGLDGETATTIRVGDESILVLGATGYAALARGVDLTEQVTLSADTAKQLRDLGIAHLEEFRYFLDARGEQDTRPALRSKRPFLLAPKN